jgi:hypothetical protein
MKKNNLIRFAQSLVFLPVMTMSLTVPNIHSNMGIAQIVLSQKVNKEEDAHAQILKAKADAIDGYFAEHDMPLEGTGMKMVEEAEKNDLDWRLLPAIAVRESTGGKNDCNKVKNNAFGWGSCKIGFKSTDTAIETVARNLGGNNPNTSHHYDNKTTKQILRAYNPPSIVPRYAEQVISIMDAIGDAEVTEIANS